MGDAANGFCASDAVGIIGAGYSCAAGKASKNSRRPSERSVMNSNISGCIPSTFLISTIVIQDAANAEPILKFLEIQNGVSRRMARGNIFSLKYIEPRKSYLQPLF